MKNILVLGSTCVDVVLKINQLPTIGQDVNIESQNLSVGGCAYNVFSMLRLFNIPCILCSPIGTGVYGNFIEKTFDELNIKPFAHISETENGCCYCIVDKSGERTFLCHHGAEYLFNKSWFDTIDRSTYDSIFLCGLELEEKTSSDLISFIESEKSIFFKKELPLDVYFAPGPRINLINKNYLERVFSLHPIVHQNKMEALSFSRKKTVSEAALYINQLTNNSVIITLGKQGSYCYDATTKKEYFLPSYKSIVVNTIGAGDSHLGSVIAGLKQNLLLPTAVLRANKIASAVVSVKESTLSKKIFLSLSL